MLFFDIINIGVNRMCISAKIFVINHKNFFVPVHSLLYPIQVGAAYTSEHFHGMLYDNNGSNISLKNKSYCELTALYWAWKNCQADYFGFFHYRRYLSFEINNLVDLTDINQKLPLAYRIFSIPDDKTLGNLGFDEEVMNEIITSFDVIAPVAEEMYVSAYNHYEQCSFHHIEDLNLVLRIITEKYAHFLSAVTEYMNSTQLYFGNIFIMKRKLFYDYCNWLFDILAEFDRRTDFSKYSGKSCRVDGYLGERLFGIYFTWLKKQNGIHCGELPRAHFEAFPGETDNFTKMRCINRILPPGTQRRFLVKKLFKCIGGI